MVPGFKPMTFGMWVSSHNHETSAPAQEYTFGIKIALF